MNTAAQAHATKATGGTSQLPARQDRFCGALSV
jgi:hypothetical protein